MNEGDEAPYNRCATVSNEALRRVFPVTPQVVGDWAPQYDIKKDAAQRVEETLGTGSWRDCTTRPTQENTLCPRWMSENINGGESSDYEWRRVHVERWKIKMEEQKKQVG